MSGDNSYGQLGQRKEKGDRRPLMITALKGREVTNVACGDFFTVAATKGEEVQLVLHCISV